MEINYFYIFFFGWLLFLTFLIYKLRNHYFNLVSKTKKERLDEILETILEKNEKLNKEFSILKEELAKEKELSKYYFQKIGLVRFNPFEKRVGDQSFVIVLLNNQNSGIILNFISTKEGLRIYTKKVIKGKTNSYQLTEEEKEAIDKAERL